MRRSPLFSGFIYFVLGSLFTYFAIHDVQQNGWGFFSYMLVFLATFDFGSGIKIFLFYFKFRNKIKDNK
jgi:Domain of unknown function (DUF4305)